MIQSGNLKEDPTTSRSIYAKIKQKKYF